jgi:CDP-diacylglycerol--glycerol-3-phosphate 3-phosphatidyltransferase
MAPVLWVIAILGNITVIHRMVFTYQESKRLEDAQLRTRSVAASNSRSV